MYYCSKQKAEGAALCLWQPVRDSLSRGDVVGVQCAQGRGFGLAPRRHLRNYRRGSRNYFESPVRRSRGDRTPRDVSVRERAGAVIRVLLRYQLWCRLNSLMRSVRGIGSTSCGPEDISG